MQLELGLWPKGCLLECVSSYLVYQSDELAEATMKDYQERGRWLYSVLGGEMVPISSITFPVLERVKAQYGPRGQGLMNVTVKRRLVFLRAALKYAADRGVIRHDQVPRIPKMPNDGKRGGVVLTATQHAAFRLALPDGRFRFAADFGAATGHHNHDLFTVEKWMVDPNREFRDEHGELFWTGGYLRRNHKNKRCVPEWFPMTPVFRKATKDYYTAHPEFGPNSILIGRLWGLCKAFASASDRAEVPRVSPKRMRTSFASNLLAAGVSPEYVRQALGHEGEMRGDATTSRPTTLSMHYAEVTPALLKGCLVAMGLIPPDVAKNRG